MNESDLLEHVREDLRRLEEAREELAAKLRMQDGAISYARHLIATIENGPEDKTGEKRDGTRDNQQ